MNDLICSASRQSVTVMTVGQIFEQAAVKKLIIPLFQRRYCWQPKQFKRFVEDIEKQITNTLSRHKFHRILISSQSDGFHILDGQQRLTTMALFMAAVRDTFHEDAELVSRINEILFPSGVPESLELDSSSSLPAVLIPTFFDRTSFFRVLVPTEVSASAPTLLTDEEDCLSVAKNYFMSALESKANVRGFGWKLLNALLDNCDVLYFAINETNFWDVYEDMTFRSELLCLNKNPMPGVGMCESDMIRNRILSKFDSEEKRIDIYNRFWVPIERASTSGVDVQSRFDTMFSHYADTEIPPQQVRTKWGVPSLEEAFPVYHIVKAYIKDFDEADTLNFMTELCAFSQAYASAHDEVGPVQI